MGLEWVDSVGHDDKIQWQQLRIEHKITDQAYEQKISVGTEQ